MQSQCKVNATDFLNSKLSENLEFNAIQ
jgi:hypothetical protein